MPDEKIIARGPLLDANHHILGYELVAQDREQGLSGDEDVHSVAAYAAAGFVNKNGDWALGTHVLFLEATPALLVAGILQQLPPQHTFLSLSMAELADPAAQEAVKYLHGQGYGLSLRGVDSLTQPETLATLLVEKMSTLSMVEMDGDAATIASQAAMLHSLRPQVRVVARHVTNWEQAELCLAASVPVLVGQLYMTQSSPTQRAAFAPNQSTILQLMDMVRQQAGVRSLEAILKRDAVLSFKLLRYINSVGFGLGSEIHSVQHAVTLLGYSTLYKWLALLLATTATGRCSAALLEAAVIRGRFAELLGEGLLPKNELENLFVTGMFSVLDKLLGMPILKILEHVHLPDSVAQALLTGDGIYGPFLALVCACETREGDAQALADSLFLSTSQVNRAHVAALAWTRGLQI